MLFLLKTSEVVEGFLLAFKICLSARIIEHLYSSLSVSYNGPFCYSFCEFSMCPGLVM